MKKLFKKVKKFTRRAFRKGKQWLKENPWFWQMALTIAIPYIAEFAVGVLKGAAINLSVGSAEVGTAQYAAAKALSKQAIQFTAGVQGVAAPTWQEIGKVLAGGGTMPQKVMGWALQAPGKVADTITGALNNSWDWMKKTGRQFFGVGSDGALADAFATAGPDKLANFGMNVERLGVAGTSDTVGAAVDLTKKTVYDPGFYTDVAYDPVEYLGYDPTDPSLYAAPKKAVYDPGFYTDVAYDPVEYLGYDPTDPSLLARDTPRDRPRGAAFSVQELNEYISSQVPPTTDAVRLDKRGEPWEAKTQELYDRAVIKANQTRTTAIRSLQAARDAALAVGDESQVALINAQLAEFTPEQIARAAPTPKELAKVASKEAPREATVGEKIVQGAMRGGRQLAQNWITGLGQDVPGSALGGGYLIDLLAWNNPSLYDELDLTEQNAGNYFGGAAYAANTQNILPEDSYYKDMPDLNKLTAPPLLRV